MAHERSVTRSQQHVIIVTRWREHYARYAQYLDHRRNRVSYIASPVARPSLPTGGTDVILVPATDDLAAVRAAARELASRHGAPDGIVALKEDDLLVGAALREDWDCPGPRTSDLVPFRDKYRMCHAIEAAGLPLPPFTPYAGRDSVLDLAAAAGWPVIVKPWSGSSGAGVQLLRGPADATALPDGPAPLLVQAYHPSPIYHVDGIFTGDELACWRASRYVNTCLGFRAGTFLGSAEEDDPRVNAAIGAASRSFLAALTSNPTPFHLELFVDAAAPGGVACTFLEAGARVGGAEIPFIWRELHGYDLMAQAFRLQLGATLETGAGDTGPGQSGTAGTGTGAGGADVGGWLLIPAPMAPPCRITEVTPMAGRRPGPYAEALLRVGDILPQADAYYEHVGGRFRFCGISSAEVQDAIAATARDFRVRAEPLGRPAPGAAAPRPASNSNGTARDYSHAILSGEGDTDYARYMRTDTLLSLQRAPDQVVHRDELLFQTVHQSTELWLKLACAEVEEAAARLRGGDLSAPRRLLGRAALSVELVTGQLEMLRHLAPWDFQTIRAVLGHGSGFESPGWRSVQRVSTELGAAFRDHVDRTGTDLAALYRGSPDDPAYQLAEAMIEWDERVSVWRVRHYKVATRIIGHGVVGTKGTPVDTLTRLIAHKFFPELWQLRTELTQTGPMSQAAAQA